MRLLIAYSHPYRSRIRGEKRFISGDTAPDRGEISGIEDLMKV